MLRTLALISFALTLSACNREKMDPASVSDSGGVVSPSGCCEASIVESDVPRGGGNTQVLVSFLNERCGSGAVSSQGVNLGLAVRWAGPETLVVSYPAHLQLARNASGEWLQCRGRKVRVLLEPHAPNNSSKRTRVPRAT